MTIDWWGFEHGFSFSLPSRMSGYILLGVALLISLYMAIVNRSPSSSEAQTGRARRLPLLLVFLLVASLATQTFLVRFPLREVPYLLDFSFEQAVPTLAILGALPWMLAGGILGVWQATLVGAIAGVVRAGFGNSSILTPVLMGMQAGMVAWLLRRDYRELPGSLSRSPLFAGLAGAIVYGLAQSLGFVAYTRGDLYDSIDLALSLSGITLLMVTVEAGIAGVICEFVKRQFAEIWYRPEKLIVGPYNRSLAARLVTLLLLVGVIASSVLLLGDWLSAVSSAREMIEEQMRQTASQASGSIPGFVRAGRSFSNQLAKNLASWPGDRSFEGIPLGDAIGSFPFFDELEVYNAEPRLIATYPETEREQRTVSQQFLADLQATLRGVPSITLEQGSTESPTARMAFLSPITLSEIESPSAVVVGWTELNSNLILAPMIESFKKFSNGIAYVTDDVGNVLIQSNGRAEIGVFNLDSFSIGEIQLDNAPDGTRRLLYVEAVKEYTWYVVVVAPLREVHRRAFLITSRLGAILIVVGLALVLAVFTISRRLTKPLKHMADMAQSIARGSLDQPIPDAGEDEIGQFASSFERMRSGLEARLQEMGLLLEVSQRLTTSFELVKILPPILEGARENVRADVVRVTLAPIEKGFALESYQAGEDPGSWATLDSQVLRLSEAQGRFTLENPARASAVLDLQALTEPIEALTALPIKHEDSFLGVLWLGHRTPYGFAADEINLLSILAGQLGVAIANARLFQRAERERLRLVAVLESTPEAVMVVNSQGRISLLNPAAVNFLEVSAEEAVGKHVSDVVTNSELSALLLDREGGDHAAEIEMGQGRVCFASVSEIHPQGVDTSGLVCVLWDVSHYKKLDTLKSEFVSTVSHDLRAPLTLMRGYATMLGMVGDMNEQQRDFLRKILASVDQMSKLVDNLLDLGRIEAGMGLSMSDVQVETLLQEVMDSYRPQAVSKQIALDVSVSDDMKPINADPTLLRQAIANLVDNAIKYTPADGKVTLRADQRDGHQMIAVQDTGVGIAPTDRARLFERFYRVRGREALGERGLGLGLAIVKSIIEQHGGRILVESKLGQGSTFTIILPMQVLSSSENEFVSPPAQETDRSD